MTHSCQKISQKEGKSVNLCLIPKIEENDKKSGKIKTWLIMRLYIIFLRISFQLGLSQGQVASLLTLYFS